MSRLEAVVRRAVADLRAAGCRFALVGGLAVSARTEPRFTRDLDLAVAVEDERAAQRLVFTLQGLGYRVLATVEQQARGRLATVRLAPPGEAARGAVLDLLFASSGIEQEVVARATSEEILPGLEAPVARVGELLALKILARDDRTRPQDRGDIAALLSQATAAELARARSALSLIERRGFQRKRKLGRELERALRELGPKRPKGRPSKLTKR